MPVVDVQPDELRRLTGHEDKSNEELKGNLFALGLEFEGVTDDGAFQLEFGPDRFGHLSVEGIARSLRYQYGDACGVPVPNTNDPDWAFVVGDDVPDERLCVTGAAARGVDLDDAALDLLIQLQEKLHAAMGRKHAKGTVGIHDLTTPKGDVLSENAFGNSITYTGIDPDGDTFVALDSNDEPTPAEVLEQHATGQKYVDLVSEYDRYPVIYGEIGPFPSPPVINGRRTEVSTDSRDPFVELTGTDQWTIDRMCNIICYVLAARGATIEEAEVQYEMGTVTKSDFEVETKHVSHDRIETVLGVELELDEVIDLFERSGLDVNVELGGETVYEVSIPPYRVDVLHPFDLVDDVSRTYGLDEPESRYPNTGTVGQRHEHSRLEDAIHTSFAGLGFEDLLNLHMISEEGNYERMDIEVGSDYLGGGEPVSITEPYSEDYTILRTWVLPSLTMVLEDNTHRAHPQDLAEIDHVAHRDDNENTHVAEVCHVTAVPVRHDATYEDAKARLAALCHDFDTDLETPVTDHLSLTDGRTAAVVIDSEKIGVIGELHPKVIVEHDLELPVAAFEFDLSAPAQSFGDYFWSRFLRDERYESRKKAEVPTCWC